MFRVPVLLALCATPFLSSAAQNAAEPPVYRIIEWRTAPADAATFRAGMVDLVKLSQETKSPNAFSVYTAENLTVVARPVQRDAILANTVQHIQTARPDAWQKWVAARPRAEQVRNEIWVVAPEWSYEPASPPTATGVSSSSVKIPSGMGATFDTVRRDFVKFRQKVGYPYPVRAYRVVVGEPRIVFVTHFDSRESFFGKNAFAALVAKAGAQAEWQALQARLSGSMGLEWDVKLWSHNAAASYMP
jgi:hypothetical protein